MNHIPTEPIEMINFQLEFGRYEGRKLLDVPTPYLYYLASESCFMLSPVQKETVMRLLQSKSLSRTMAASA